MKSCSPPSPSSGSYTLLSFCAVGSRCATPQCGPLTPLERRPLSRPVFCAGLAFSAYLGYQSWLRRRWLGASWCPPFCKPSPCSTLTARKLNLRWGVMLSTAGPGLVLGLVTLCAAGPATFLHDIHWLSRLGLGCFDGRRGRPRSGPGFTPVPCNMEPTTFSPKSPSACQLRP